VRGRHPGSQTDRQADSKTKTENTFPTTLTTAYNTNIHQIQIYPLSPTPNRYQKNHTHDKFMLYAVLDSKAKFDSATIEKIH